MAQARINVSLTEMAHFRRLVGFLRDVEEHADEQCDVTLQALVHEVRDDLARLAVEGDER
jgi:hypothetical protein